MAKEKIVTGGMAVFGCHWPHKNGFLSGTLYVENPEMEYVPIGPVKTWKGESGFTNSREGRSGFPSLIFGTKNPDLDKFLAFVDFINSDEGLKLSCFGTEGVSYNLVNGVPLLNEEWEEIKMSNTTKWFGEGFGIAPQIIGSDRRISRGWDPEYELEAYRYARTFTPIRFFEGRTASEVANLWPGKSKYDEHMATVNYTEDIRKPAMVAATEDEALRLLNSYRNRMIEAGYNEMIAFMLEYHEQNPGLVVY
jgi:putative aldouronate transport system substrate-binding protein